MQRTFTWGEKKLLKGLKMKYFRQNLTINLKNNRLVKKEPPKKSTKTDFDKLNKQIIKEETEINEELFKKHFHFQTPTAMLKYSYNLNDRNKNNKLVDIIKSGLDDLENEI